MNDDAILLRRYVEERSEDAFTHLVERYVDLVYSAALRRTGGRAHHAADVVQDVFTYSGEETNMFVAMRAASVVGQVFDLPLGGSKTRPTLRQRLRSQFFAAKSAKNAVPLSVRFVHVGDDFIVLVLFLVLVLARACSKRRERERERGAKSPHRLRLRRPG